jgi:catechol 2,3-dioxygenase-like lactoylglutathione lyase family enzyme
MEVRNVRWVGIATDRYDEMVSFLRDVLGLRTNFEEPTTIEFETSEGDEIQLMAPGDPYYDFFSGHATGPVPLFEVDDVGVARSELEAAGIEIVGPPGRDSNWEWIHVRAPDGNLYELASRLRR